MIRNLSSRYLISSSLRLEESRPLYAAPVATDVESKTLFTSNHNPSNALGSTSVLRLTIIAKDRSLLCCFGPTRVALVVQVGEGRGDFQEACDSALAQLPEDTFDEGISL